MYAFLYILLFAIYAHWFRAVMKAGGLALKRTYKCKTGHIGGYFFQIQTQNYFKYFYHRPVNVYLRFKIAG
jgi:hypothetical protein